MPKADIELAVSAIAASLIQLLSEDLGNRVLDFDTSAALEAAALAAVRQRAGHALDMREAQIAGIALARKASIATECPPFRGPESANRQSVEHGLGSLRPMEPPFAQLAGENVAGIQGLQAHRGPGGHQVGSGHSGAHSGNSRLLSGQ